MYTFLGTWAIEIREAGRMDQLPNQESRLISEIQENSIYDKMLFAKKKKNWRKISSRTVRNERRGRRRATEMAEDPAIRNVMSANAASPPSTEVSLGELSFKSWCFSDNTNIDLDMVMSKAPGSPPPSPGHL